MNEILTALKKIRTSGQTIALTGAGISAPSGIPDFRSAYGLWKKYDPSVYADIRTFRREPLKVWDLAMTLLDLSLKAQPNRAHIALAMMEERSLLHGIITQNIDNLHRRAGSRNVINYHGELGRAICVDCNVTANVEPGAVPVCENCGKIMKPAFTMFGESVPPAAYLEARNLASFSGVFMVIGTSAVVQPAADLPFTAKENGAYIIEMNREETGLTNYITDCFIKGALEETLPAFVSRLW